MNTIKIAIVGYGNVGKGVHKSIKKNEDMSLAGIMTRNPSRVLGEGVSSQLVFDANNTDECLDIEADVAVLCGGSKNDLFNDKAIEARGRIFGYGQGPLAATSGRSSAIR